MPHIEELPTTAKAAAPGWSYVVDTGYDPSKQAINPTNRKRVRISAAAGLSAGDLTVRQQTAIQRRIDYLGKDSHKPVAIALPKSKLLDRKQTANVRRILASGKDFAHYLEEEQAAAALKGGPSAAGAAAAAAALSTAATSGGAGTAMDIDAADAQPKPKPAQRASKTPIARRKPALVNLPPSSSESSPAPSLPAISMGPPPVPARSSLSKEVTPAPAAAAKTSGTPDDSLLAPSLPSTITAEEIEVLLSAPPLPYAAARSAPPNAAAPPQRVFCEICGFWGRVKCLKCGARVCGLECKGAHEESRCIRF
ncbi:hypothetical protein MBLNU459_g7130t1 [Dothideomycetes sp. NU459]